MSEQLSKFKINRRSFLKVAAVTVAGWVLTGCGPTYEIPVVKKPEQDQKKLQNTPEKPEIDIKAFLETRFSTIVQANSGYMEALAYIFPHVWDKITGLEKGKIKERPIIPLKYMPPGFVLLKISFLDTKGPIIGEKDNQPLYATYYTDQDGNTKIYEKGQEALVLDTVGWFVSTSRYPRSMSCNFWDKSALQTGLSVEEKGNDQNTKYTNISRAVVNFLAICVQNGYTSTTIPDDLTSFKDAGTSQVIASLMKHTNMSVGELFVYFRTNSPDLFIGRLLGKDASETENYPKIKNVYQMLDILLAGVELGENDPNQVVKELIANYDIPTPSPAPLPDNDNKG